MTDAATPAPAPEFAEITAAELRLLRALKDDQAIALNEEILGALRMLWGRGYVSRSAMVVTDLGDRYLLWHQTVWRPAPPPTPRFDPRKIHNE